MYLKKDSIEWTIQVPILHNSIIMKQLGIAIGIPFALLIIFLLVVEAYYGVGLILVLFLLTVLFILVIWGGKYDVGFELGENGVRSFTLPEQANKNRIINTAAIISGLLSGKPTVAGAGILAQSRQDITIRWKNIKKVRYLPSKNMILLRGSLTENIAIFCTPENYTEVEAFIRSVLRNGQ